MKSGTCSLLLFALLAFSDAFTQQPGKLIDNKIDNVVTIQLPMKLELQDWNPGKYGSVAKPGWSITVFARLADPLPNGNDTTGLTAEYDRLSEHRYKDYQKLILQKDIWHNGYRGRYILQKGTTTGSINELLFYLVDGHYYSICLFYPPEKSKWIKGGKALVELLNIQPGFKQP
jgi:hypothetical protein